jgi:DNA-binding CsgD family transcriptional regulator
VKRQACGADDLGYFADALSAAQSVDERWASLTKLFASYGADQINYGVLDLFSFDLQNAPVSFLSTMDPDWIAHYGAQRLDIHDPHVKFVRQGRLQPYRWSERILPQLADDAEQDAVRQTVDAGLRSQIHMIAPNPLGLGAPIGGLTIGSSLRAEDYFRSVEGLESVLVSAASLFHHYAISETRRQQVGAIALSPRERDCMIYVARGLRTVRIAERLGLSEVTVELYLRNARQKLKAVTTSQAVARAMIFGDIEI